MQIRTVQKYVLFRGSASLGVITNTICSIASTFPTIRADNAVTEGKIVFSLGTKVTV